MKLKSKISELQELKTELASDPAIDPRAIDAVRSAIVALDTMQMAINDLEWRISKCRSGGEIYDLGKIAGYEDALLVIKCAGDYKYD